MDFSKCDDASPVGTERCSYMGIRWNTGCDCILKNKSCNIYKGSLQVEKESILIYDLTKYSHYVPPSICYCSICNSPISVYPIKCKCGRIHVHHYYDFRILADHELQYIGLAELVIGDYIRVQDVNIDYNVTYRIMDILDKNPDLGDPLYVIQCISNGDIEQLLYKKEAVGNIMKIQPYS